MVSEREELEALLSAPGWLRLKSFAEKRWTGDIVNLLRPIANDENDERAMAKMRQAIAAKDAVDALLAWPVERAKQLRSEAEATLREVLPVRGGY